MTCFCFCLTGCNDGTKCYNVGDVIQGRCYQAECKLNANKTVVYLDVVRGGMSITVIIIIIIILIIIIS